MVIFELIYSYSALIATLWITVGFAFTASQYPGYSHYALSAAKVIRTLPWLTWVIYLISALCIIRGLLGIQLWIRLPHLMDPVATSVSFAWLISGLLFLMGYRLKNN